MRLWAVNTEKAEEKSPLVEAIMVGNYTHTAVASPKALQCTHNVGGKGRDRIQHDLRKHPGLPGSAPTQCPRALSVFGNDKGALQ